MTKFFVTMIVIAVCTYVMPSNVFAFGPLDKLKKSVTSGGESKGVEVDIAGLASQGDGLIKKFVSALLNMRSAQLETEVALGLKNESELKDAEAKHLESGNVDNDTLDKLIERTKESQKAIDKKLKEGAVLDAEAKGHLIAAVPFYSKGILSTVWMPKEFQSFTKVAKNGIKNLKSNPKGAMKLKKAVNTPLFIGKNIPSLVKNFTRTTKTFLKCAKTNNVDTGNISSKIGEL